MSLSIPFGYGLSYTEFEISTPELTADTLSADGSLEASVTVTNKGTRQGTETLQLYIQDVFASVVRPVKELKGFQKVTLEPGKAGKKRSISTKPCSASCGPMESLAVNREHSGYGSETAVWWKRIKSLNADKHSLASSARSTKRRVRGLMSVGVESSH
ncbi:MAG: fibronectin type III-like domain-contianing protein [Lachnospiraceae bacterium]